MSRTRRDWLSHEDIRTRLLRRIEKSGLSVTQWAIKHEVSTTMVWRAIHRKGETGHRLMEALGVEIVPHFAVRAKPHEQNDTDSETEPSENDNDPSSEDGNTQCTATIYSLPLDSSTAHLTPVTPSQ